MPPSYNSPILVTGGNGFVASHIISQLLAKGYRVRLLYRFNLISILVFVVNCDLFGLQQVRTSVRDITKEANYAFLKSLPNADNNLEIFPADLNNVDSFSPGFTDVEIVLHVASPYVLNVTNPQKDLVDPAVNGTKAILDLCHTHPLVKRLVLTSSVAAVSDCFDSNKIYNEDDWNVTSSLVRNPYYYSKTLAEREAVRFMEEHPDTHFDLVRINPFVVLGPSLNGKLNESHQALLAFLDGTVPGVIDVSHSICDVRDIATAHIVAFENPEASGR